ncbi:MAG: LCP family protein [Lachnospira sp.]
MSNKKENSRGRSTSNSSTNKKKLSKKQLHARRKKINQRLTIAGLVLVAIQFIVSAVFVTMLHYTNLVPLKYKLLIVLVLVLLFLLVFFTQRWRGVGIFTKLLSLVLSAVMIVGCVYVAHTKGALSKITDVDKEVSVINVYVRADSSIQSLNDIKSSKCGKLGLMDEENTQVVIDYIKDNSSATPSYVDYNSINELMDGLLNKQVEAIIVNASYLGILKDVDEYSDLNDRIRSIYSTEVEREIVNTVNENYLSGEHVIAIYFSGIDVYDGEMNDDGRSDVNIIGVLNTKTHQFFLLNTPRDYYVPLSISNGVRDKLTHAGSKGVSVSIETLEMLYQLNIDYYVKVNFSGFIGIIDYLGGIDVYSEYDFTSYHGNFHFSKGYNHMDGEQALGFTRERYAFATGDVQRGKNQMEVIKAVAKKMISTNALANYTSILNSISSSMTTNMSYDKVAELVNEQLSTMAAWDIQTYTVTGFNDHRTMFSSSIPNYVMIPDEEKVAQAKDYLRMIYNDEIIDTKVETIQSSTAATN